MPDPSMADLGLRIAAALNCPPANEVDMLPHLRWQLGEIMSRVKPSDLSAAEIKAMLAVLDPANSGGLFVVGPPGRPLLRAVGDSSPDLVGLRIAAALNCPPANEVDLRLQLGEIMSRVKLCDLSSAEMIALLAVLAPAHSRVLIGVIGPPRRPVLRAVGTSPDLVEQCLD